MSTNITQKQTRFFGYAIEQSLYKQVVDLITQINQGERGDTDRLSEMSGAALIEVTDAGFQAYYERPAQLAHISPRVKKASDAGMHAVQKGIHMVIRKLMKNRSLNDLKQLATSLSYLICVDNSDPSKAYACFRLDEELFQRVVAIMNRAHTDSNIEAYRSEMIESIEALIATGVDNFYSKPIGKAEIGRITRKAADIGIHTVQKGSNAVVHKVFKDMDHGTLLPMAQYFETLLHTEVKTYKHRYLSVAK